MKHLKKFESLFDQESISEDAIADYIEQLDFDTYDFTNATRENLDSLNWKNENEDGSHILEISWEEELYEIGTTAEIKVSLKINQDFSFEKKVVIVDFNYNELYNDTETGEMSDTSDIAAVLDETVGWGMYATRRI